MTDAFQDQFFDLAPIAMWLEDFSGVHAQFEAWRAEGVRLAAERAGAGEFDIEIARTLPLERAADAQRMLEDGTAPRGKIVLLP